MELGKNLNLEAAFRERWSQHTEWKQMGCSIQESWQLLKVPRSRKN